MKLKGACRRAAVVAILFVATVASAWAVDVEKKFRFSLQIGGYDTEDEVRSNAANALFVLDTDRTLIRVVRDPRDESSALGSLQIKAAPRVMAAVQFAASKKFVVEASAGYQRGDVGDVEVQLQPIGAEIPESRQFLFFSQRVPVGELEQIPIQISAIGRFRPRSNFNPYFGGGAGYTIVGFSLSEELDTLSFRMDESRGSQQAVVSFGEFGQVGPTEDLRGAEIKAPDYFEWHVLGGAEYSFNRRWSMFADLRYVFASGEFEVRFNGTESLGVPVPNTVAFIDEPISDVRQYGPVFVGQGGLLDFGQLVPREGAPEDTDCAASPGECRFVTEKDGVPDLGYYYVDGGKIKYGGWSFAIGVRYTF